MGAVRVEGQAEAHPDLFPFPGDAPHPANNGRLDRHGRSWPQATAPPQSGIDWTSGAELMSTDFPEPKWAVPGLVAEGVTLLAGPPKVGKSWLALDLALSVAGGGRALGKIPVEAGKVAMLALEDTGRRLQRRLRMLLAGEAIPDGLGITTDAPALDDGLLDALDALDTASLRLVVVDVLQRVRPRSGSDSVYERDYSAVAALKGWSDRHDVPVIAVHHTRKAGSDDFLDTVSGSHGLAGAADAVLVMRRARNAADATVAVTGRDVEEAEHALRFDATRGAWTLLDGPAGDYELGDTRRAILEVLREYDEPLGPTAVAQVTGLKVEVVKVRLREMAKAGQAQQQGRGRYTAPPLPVTSITPVTSEVTGNERNGGNGEQGVPL